ncbi:MAG TPA: COX15/CtaA family protein [Paenibacillaceae bacterium]
MDMSPKIYRRLTFWTWVGMFLVLLGGVLVTNTDSGLGCGTDFPLCNGKLLPDPTPESIIEYSHRLATGLTGLLIIVSFAATWLKPYRSAESLTYAWGLAGFTVLQSALGAAAVMRPQSSAVMALHFGISLIAFAFSWLLADYGRTIAAAKSGDEAKGAAGRPSLRPVSRAMVSLTASLLAYCYIVVYLGAFIRHTGSAGGCVGWPLCNGEIIPDLAGETGIAFLHRMAALVLVAGISALAVFVSRLTDGRQELVAPARASLVLVLLQALSGGVLALTIHEDTIYVFTAMLHTLFISLLFGQLTLLFARTLKLARSPAPAADVRRI